VHPDPLEFLYDYPEVHDREVVGLVASALAYGRVAQILSSVSSVLEILGPEPCDFVGRTSRQALERKLEAFKHRFTTGSDVAALLAAAGVAIKDFGSLNRCFTSGLSTGDDTVIAGLGKFASELRGRSGGECDYLLAAPARGSACKRLNLYLRWMVRSDEVDPGGWTGVSPSMLVVPLDTHMHRAGLALGLTRRRQANMRTALEITEGFRRIAPDDPVRYDFCLTRLGIRGDMSLDEFIALVDQSQG
jgi:uncharacterized protein (TIGR02757 family)